MAAAALLEAGRCPGAAHCQGLHRSAGPVDLVIAATAELQGLTLLHRDHDFDCIATVTGQAMQWYGPEPGK
jgi:predicted nucleic acid-binding protein